jgi:succinate dehydrogenase hydrophobic anchor subunit
MSAPPQIRPAWERPLTATPVPEGDRSHLVEYVVLRLTGLVLAVLVLGHFAVTHVVTDVSHDTSAFVARRLASALWIAWDGAMLAAALAHGVAGIRIAAADYVHSARARILVDRGLPALGVVLLVLGLIAIARVAHV